MSRARPASTGFVRQVRLDPDTVTGRYSFTLPVVRHLASLGDHLVLRWGTRKPRTGFFLRAESFYNVATEIDRLDKESPYPLLPAYGGRSLHERSHGESFLDVVTHRFGPDGLYLLDEPEAALSVRGCLALVARIADLVNLVGVAVQLWTIR